MKKENLATLSILCVMCIAVMIFAACGKTDSGTQTTVTTTTATTPVTTAATTTATATTATTAATTKKSGTAVSLADALFIGDSRTVGIMEYAGIQDADFFCNVGMSVFSAQKVRVSVKSVGKVTLEELLSHKKYGRIYIMLGINELGYGEKSILNKYGALVDFIKGQQPDATVCIEANLHVSQKRSEGSKSINNPSLDRLNTALSAFAKERGLLYLDANTVFDDENGSLPADKTSDGVHLYAKYYARWGEWIAGETARLMKEGRA